MPTAVEEIDVEIRVLGIAGNIVAELGARWSDTIGDLKRQIATLRPSAPLCWQRLLFEDRELNDVDIIKTLGPIDEAVGFIQCNLIVTISPRDLLDTSRAYEAAKGLDALGCSAAPYLAALFEDDAGERISVQDAESILEGLSRKLSSYRDLELFKVALVPHVMWLLASSTEIALNRRKCSGIFMWLGNVVVPHVVAWLGLLERPLDVNLRSRVDLLRSVSESPRVRLAAKAALSDPGGASTARVEELSRLRSSLGRDISQLESLGILWAKMKLEETRNGAKTKLCELKDSAADCKVRYAAQRALKNTFC